MMRLAALLVALLLPACRGTGADGLPVPEPMDMARLSPPAPVREPRTRTPLVVRQSSVLYPRVLAHAHVVQVGHHRERCAHSKLG